MSATKELEAGVELDALVAEKVMGCRWYAMRTAGSPERRCFIAAPAYVAGWAVEDVTDGERPERFSDWNRAAGLPNYSSDIAAAFDILAKWNEQIGDAKLTMENGLWKCELFRPSYEWLAWAVTAPLAICRAAIKSIGDGK